MDKDEIDIILLVGGSTKIPKVKEWLTEWMGFDEDEAADKFDLQVDPDIAVAEGATIMAGILSNQITTEAVGEEEVPVGGFVKPIVADVTPLSIGLALAGDKVSNLIKAQSKTPCEKEKVFVTNRVNQQEILVRII